MLTVTHDMLYMQYSLSCLPHRAHLSNLQGRALLHGPLPGDLRRLARRGFVYLTAGQRECRRA